ncbi:hypothetical protein BV898_00491 [Hypsibius exemplaris]|uniref:Uncharacterized protein n=1 Tax=Hypsibius exemplaris TaxID=2072580 RepID=A0A1W0XDL5_HYPEX|nr:hypothetical protein BV898_00491 [Hypsibius exemplaris]
MNGCSIKEASFTTQMSNTRSINTDDRCVPLVVATMSTACTALDNVSKLPSVSSDWRQFSGDQLGCRSLVESEDLVDRITFKRMDDVVDGAVVGRNKEYQLAAFAENGG